VAVGVEGRVDGAAELGRAVVAGEGGGGTGFVVAWEVDVSGRTGERRKEMYRWNRL